MHAYMLYVLCVCCVCICVQLQEATAGGGGEMPIETDDEKAAREKSELDKKKELEDIDIKTGDYQIQVHIIEARDLKAENFDGQSIYLSMDASQCITFLHNSFTLHPALFPRIPFLS